MKLKVFGGPHNFCGKVVRAIVAAASQKEAARLTGESLNHIRSRWVVTQNVEELEIALGEPGVVFIVDKNGSRNYRKKEDAIASSTATLICIGGSSDGRTNRWRVTCSCGNSFIPATTMYARDVVGCPKCRRRWAVNYNEEKIEYHSKDD